MTCEQLRDSYELYALGLADEPEQTAILEHLGDRCPVCSDGVNHARALNASVLALAPDAAPPARLRRRIMASIGAEPERQWGWSWVWAAAAAAFAIVAFVYMGQVRETNRQLAYARSELGRTASELTNTAADRSRLEQAIQLLEQPDTEQVSFGGAAAQPPRGRVILNPRRGVLLIAANLPPVAAGRTYEMWLLPKTGGPRPAGLFQSAATGTAIHFLPGAVDRSQIAGVAVSVEPATGSLSPTTTPIIVAKL
jgi:hypothetical protein